jgi:hypothetical protein
VTRIGYHRIVREFLLMMAVGLVLCAIAVVRFVDPGSVMLFGREVMLASLALAIPFELAYFAGLAWASRRGDFPRRWYWRSYEHHGRLRPGERRWVLACFAVGSLCMLVSVLGILAVVAAGIRAVYG